MLFSSAQPLDALLPRMTLTAAPFPHLSCFFAYQLAFLDKKSHERYLISSPSILAGVNIILVISFLSRGLYQFGTIFRIFLLSDIPLQVLCSASTSLFFTVQLLVKLRSCCRAAIRMSLTASPALLC